METYYSRNRNKVLERRKKIYQENKEEMREYNNMFYHTKRKKINPLKNIIHEESITRGNILLDEMTKIDQLFKRIKSVTHENRYWYIYFNTRLRIADKTPDIYISRRDKDLYVDFEC